MKYQLIDTNTLDAECLEETDFQIEAEIIQAKKEFIIQSGQLALPVICWQSHYDQDSQAFVFEAYEEQTNLLNLLTMLALYRENPQQWHLTPAWLCDSQSEAEMVATQYIYYQLA